MLARSTDASQLDVAPSAQPQFSSCTSSSNTAARYPTIETNLTKHSRAVFHNRTVNFQTRPSLPPPKLPTRKPSQAHPRRGSQTNHQARKPATMSLNAYVNSTTRPLPDLPFEPTLTPASQKKSSSSPSTAAR